MFGALYHYRRCMGGILLLVALHAAQSASAEDAEDHVGTRAGPPMRPFYLQLRYTPSEIFRADFKDEPGRITILHHDISGTLMIPLGPATRINFSVSHDQHTYRFRDNEQLADAPADVYESQVVAAYMGPITRDWSLFAMGGARSATEKGASRSDNLMPSGMVMFQREWRDGLRIGVGGMAAAQLDHRPLIIPTGSIDWEITDRWRLRTARGLHLFYKPDHAGKWETGLNSEYHSRYVRLRDDGMAPDGTLRSRLIVTTLSLMYRPNPGVSIGAEIGYVPWRKITIRNEDKRTVFESRTEDGFTAAFTSGMTF